MKRMVKNGDLIDVEPDGSITVAGKPIGGGGGASVYEITISVSDLTPSQTQDKWASFPASINTEIDSLFEGVDGFQTIRLTYPNDEGYMTLKLDNVSVEGGSKILSYSSNMLTMTIQVRKDPGAESYSLITDTNVTQFLATLESIVLTKLS